MNNVPRVILKDQQARDEIRTCLDDTLMVEAGAGTGKTKSLVDRMASLIAEGKCRIGSIAAVTFTRKAAGELETRFQNELEAKLRGEADPLKRERIAEALAGLDSAFIGTIHSFCSRILRERPVEAGISPEFSEIEGVEEELLRRAAWDDYLIEVRLNEPQKLQRLVELDLSSEDLWDAFKTIATYPDLEFPCGPALYPELEELRKQLKSFCRIATKYLPQGNLSKPDNLQKIILMIRRREKIEDLYNANPSGDRALLRLATVLNRSSIKGTHKCWDSKDDCLAVGEAFNSLRDNYVIPVLQAWRAHRYPHLLDFLMPAADHYRETRRRAGVLNFQDLLMRTAEMLRGNPEVRRYFQDRFTHLLIDEFQDTDPIQAKIMLYLGGEDTKEKNWTALKPRSGSLFIVGDPKQSIYRFRRADIATYNQVKEIINQSGGRILYLTTNFRSHMDLTSWSNRVFEDLFPTGQNLYQADFVGMDSPADTDPLNCIEPVQQIAVADVKYNSSAEIARQDAQQIGALITSAVNDSETPIKADDFLIIVRFKKNIAIYARELERLGIPYRITGQSDISEASEICELLIVLQALADPDNPVYLAAVLRGLFYGLSDNLLYRFKQAGGRFSFLGKVPEGDSLVKSSFEPIFRQLARFWKLTRKLPLSSAVALIAAELGLIPLILASDLGRSKAGYYYRLLEGLRSLEQENRSGFTEAVAYLAQMLEAGFEDELDIEGGERAAVRIMNLHKAKGLEGTIVFLADPGYNISHQPAIHVSRAGGKSEGYPVISKKGLYGSEVLAHHPAWVDSLRDEESCYAEAEELRLLYVAATRARNRLVVSTYPKKPENSAWAALNDYLPAQAIEIEPAAGVPLQTVGQKPVTPADLDQAVEEIRGGKEKMAVPTYSQQSVTAIKNQAINLPERKEVGYGTRWGTVVHAALDLLVEADGIVTSKTLEMKLLAALEQEGLEAERLPELQQLLENFRAGKLWLRIKAAIEVYREMPFGFWEEDSYTTGVIDLAIHEKEGWVIVDYKTDRIEDQAHLDKLILYYRPQVELYRRHFTEISGQEVAEAALYFTDWQHYAPIK